MSIIIDNGLLAQVNAQPDIQSAVLYLRANGVYDPSDISDYLTETHFNTALASSTDGSAAGSTGSGSAFNLQTLIGLGSAAGGAVQLKGLFTGTSAAVNAATQTALTAKNAVLNAQAIVNNDQSFLAAMQAAGADDVTLASIQGQLELDQQTVASLNTAAEQASLGVQQAQIDVQSSGGMLSKIKDAFNYVMNSQIIAPILAAAAVYGTWAMAGAAALDPNFKNIAGLGASVFSAFEALGSQGFYNLLVHMGLSLHTAAFLTNPYMLAMMLGAIVLGSILSALSKHDAPASDTSPDVSGFTNQIPDLLDSLQSAAVVALVGGLTVGGVSYNVTQGTPFHYFQVDTMALASTVPGASGTNSANGIVPQILYSKGSGPQGTDVVYLVTPGSNGMSNIDAFAVDSNGYVVGPNGPDASYLPFFQPKIVNGKLVGVNENMDALNAVLQMSAGAALANDTSLTPQQRQAANETGSRANKNVTFVPIQNPS